MKQIFQSCECNAFQRKYLNNQVSNFNAYTIFKVYNPFYITKVKERMLMGE